MQEDNLKKVSGGSTQHTVQAADDNDIDQAIHYGHRQRPQEQRAHL